MSSLFRKSKGPRVNDSSIHASATAHSSHTTEGEIVTSTAREQHEQEQKPRYEQQIKANPPSTIYSFQDLNLCPSLVRTCAALGYKRPTPVQRAVIPAILSSSSSHILALSATGSGKTAAFVLPILHTLAQDPYGIYAVVLTPTRELAKQIVEQVLALGSSIAVKASLVVGGMDQVRQSCELATKRPHFCVATPGRLAALLRGPEPPILRNLRYIVLDEADRLLSGNSGFERDVAEVLLHSTTAPSTDNGQKRTRRVNCQTLLFSATSTRSLASLEQLAGCGIGRLPLRKFVIREDDVDDDTVSERNDLKKRTVEGKDQGGDDDDNDLDDQSASSAVSENISERAAEFPIPSLPSGLRQEYIFMPSHVRDAYLITAVRTIMESGGRKVGDGEEPLDSSGWNNARTNDSDIEEDTTKLGLRKARSAIIFVSTCERAAFVSGILTELGVGNVALHSLLTQNRRLASLAKFKSQHVRVLVATDVASRGLDIPTVDLVLNSELPRRPVDYVHRVGRTARAGRRGLAVSLVSERDIALVQAAEKMTGRTMNTCADVTDDMAVKLLGPVSKAARLTKMKLLDIGFDKLVETMKERKARDRRERQKAEKRARMTLNKSCFSAS